MPFHQKQECCKIFRQTIGSKGFVIKSVVLLVVICAPGNILTAVLLYKQWSSTDEVANVSNKISPMSTSSNESTTQNSLLSEEKTEFQIPVCDKDMAFNSTIKCYECIDEYKSFRENTRYWLEGVMIFIVGIIGLGCNVMVVVILRLCKGNKNFNILLRCLAIIDTILIVDMLIERSLVYHFSEPIWYKTMYPYFWHPIKGIFLSATIFTVVAVSAERYRAVCHPLSRRHSPCKYMSMVITVAVASKIPRFFHFTVEKFEDGTLEHMTTDLMEDPTYIWFTAYWDEIVVTGFLPFLILIYFNIRIYLKLIASRRMKNCRYSGGLRKNRSSRHSASPQTQEMELATRWHHLNLDNIFSDRKRKQVLPRRNSLHLIDYSSPNEISNSHLRKSISLFDNSTNPTRSKIIKNDATKNLLVEESRSMYFHRQSCQNSCRKKITTEKTSFILIAIVVLFLLTHSYRLAIKFYEALMPQSNTADNFDICFSLGRHHVPVAFYILFHLNNLFIVSSCSANFIIYCCVAKAFRVQALDLMKSCLKIKQDTAVQV